MRRREFIGLVAGALAAGASPMSAAAESLKVAATIDTGSGALNRVRWAPDGKHFVTAAAGGKGVIFNASGSRVADIAASRGPMFNARFDAASAQIVTTAYDGTIARWTVDGRKLEERRIKSAAVTDALFTSDSLGLVYSSDDGSTSLATLEGKQRWSISRPGVARNLGAVPDGTLVAATSDSGLVTLIAIDGTVRGQIETGQGRLNSVAFSADGAYLVTAGRDGNVVIWSVAGREVRRFVPGAGFGGFVNGADFTPDGASVVAVFDDGSLLYAAMDGTHEARQKIAAVPLNGVACAPGSRRCAVAGADGNVRVLMLDSIR